MWNGYAVCSAVHSRVVNRLETTLVPCLSIYVSLTNSVCEINESIVKQLTGCTFARGPHFGTAPGPACTSLNAALAGVKIN